jgi:hypothetical protein
MTTRRYSDLIDWDTFEDRYEYLRLGGTVGVETFGFDRYINQDFYRSYEWKSAREQAIIRDNGCDLGIEGHEIHGQLLVHHMNPMTAEEVMHGVEWITDPEFLITTCHITHNAIHYGDRTLLRTPYVARVPGDTRLW